MFKRFQRRNNSCLLVKSYIKDGKQWIKYLQQDDPNPKEMPLEILFDKHQQQLANFSHQDISTLSALAHHAKYPTNFNQTKVTAPFWLISTCFMLQITLLLASHQMSGKLITVYGNALIASTLYHPVIYMISQVITELYDTESTYTIIGLMAISSLLFILLIKVSVAAPSPPNWQYQSAYELVYYLSSVCLFATATAFTIGNITCCHLLITFKKHYQQLSLFFRLLLSNVLGFLVNCLIYLAIVKAKLIGKSQLINILLNLCLVMLIYQTVLSGIANRIIDFFTRKPLFNHPLDP